MAIRQDSLNSWAWLINEAYKQAEMSVERLHRRYILMGGEMGQAGFRSWMNGETEPQATDFTRVCQILNARARELEKEPLLPDLQLPGTPPSGGISSDPPGDGEQQG